MLFPSPIPLTHSFILSLKISDIQYTATILPPDGLRHYARLALGLKIILPKILKNGGDLHAQ